MDDYKQMNVSIYNNVMSGISLKSETDVFIYLFLIVRPSTEITFQIETYM